jgi:hypothetical protein
VDGAAHASCSACGDRFIEEVGRQGVARRAYGTVGEDDGIRSDARENEPAAFEPCSGRIHDDQRRRGLWLHLADPLLAWLSDRVLGLRADAQNGQDGGNTNGSR